MRKFTLFLASLFLTLGAMAQTVAYTVNANTGTLYKNGTEAASNWNSKWAFTVTEANPAALTLTTTANNIGKYTENGIGYLGLAGGQTGTSVYTLAVPEGYLIDSYSFDIVAVSGAATHWRWFFVKSAKAFAPTAVAFNGAFSTPPLAET